MCSAPPGCYSFSVPLFHAFGRIGCFLVGCCYGVESSIGFTFHNSIIESANNVNRFPVQIVEALFNLILFFCLYNFFKHKKFKGYLLNIYFIFYPVFRFIIEFFRADSYRGFLGVLRYKENLKEDEELKIYKNGSTIETVYADSNCTIKIGELEKYEECQSFGIVNDRAIVLYNVNNTENKKIGFVKYKGRSKIKVNIMFTFFIDKN